MGPIKTGRADILLIVKEMTNKVLVGTARIPLSELKDQKLREITAPIVPSQNNPDVMGQITFTAQFTFSRVQIAKDKMQALFRRKQIIEKDILSVTKTEHPTDGTPAPPSALADALADDGSDDQDS